MVGRDLSTGSIRSHTWNLAWPTMLSIFFQTVYGLVDAWWVGRLSEFAIAAVGISQITLFAMIALTIGVTVGSGVLMAMHIGKRDIPGAERVLGQSFVLNFFAAVFFTTVALVFRSPLLQLNGAEEQSILPLALDYFTITASASFTMFLFFAVVFGFNAQGDNRTVTVLFACSAVLNAVLDPLLIFGWAGFPELGIRGAAVATVISQVLILVAGVTLLKVRPMMVRFRFGNLTARWESVKRVLSIGFPAALTSVLGPVALAILAGIVASRFDAAGAAGFSIGFRVEFFGFLPAVGFGVAALALIGQNMGARNPERARAAFRTAVLFAFVLGSVIGGLAALMNGAIVGTFSDDPVIAGYARSYLTSVPLTYGVFAASFVVVSSFQALGPSWSGFAVTALRVTIMLVLGLAVTAGLAPQLNRLWWVVIGANLAAAAVGLLWLRGTFARVTAAAAAAGSGPAAADPAPAPASAS